MDSSFCNLYSFKDLFLISANSTLIQFFFIMFLGVPATLSSSSVFSFALALMQWYIICQCAYLMHSISIQRRCLIFFYNIYNASKLFQPISEIDWWNYAFSIHQCILNNHWAHWKKQIESLVVHAFLSLVAFHCLFVALSYRTAFQFKEDSSRYFHALFAFNAHHYAFSLLGAFAHLNVLIVCRYLETFPSLSFVYFKTLILNLPIQTRPSLSELNKVFSVVEFLLKNYSYHRFNVLNLFFFAIVQGQFFLLLHQWQSSWAFFILPCLMTSAWLIFYRAHLKHWQRQHLIALEHATILKKLLK